MKLIKIQQVIQKTGCSRSFIYALMSKDAFPKSIKIGTRAVAWLEKDIDDWILSQKQNLVLGGRHEKK